MALKSSQGPSEPLCHLDLVVRKRVSIWCECASGLFIICLEFIVRIVLSTHFLSGEEKNRSFIGRTHANKVAK